MEQWKSVEGYDGLYEVSDLGRVKSLGRLIMRKNGRPQNIREKILKPGLNSWGYLQVSLFNNVEKKTHKIHRLVAKEFIPNLHGYNEVNHLNGNKLNNNVINLEWCTSSENTKHAFKLGLMNHKGEKNHNNKLIVTQVKKIRELLQTTNMTQRKIGNLFGVSHITISDIKRNKTWVQ